MISSGNPREPLTAVRDDILAGNPRGQEGGLQYWDGLTDPDESADRKADRERNAESLSPRARSRGTLIQIRAEAAGMNTQAYLDASYKDGQLFGNV